MEGRNQLIDSLRGFSIIVMILTHVTAFYPGDKVAFTLWNWSNFAVPIFIFCSAYLFLKKSSDKPLHFFSYLKKRSVRLLVPYFIFLMFFLIVLFIISPQILTFKYLWQSVFVIGGVDINWLVLLFLYITILLPFFTWSHKKNPLIYWSFFIASFGSSVYLLLDHVSLPYKWIMWLPWSIVIFFTWWYIRYEQNKKALYWLFACCSLLFILSFSILTFLNKDTIFIHNKYPPNILYLSYGFTVLLGLTFVAKYLFRQRYVLLTINFFSKHSYSLYFLHYIILTIAVVFIKQFSLQWYELFLIVILLTVLLQYIYNVVKSKKVIARNTYKIFSSQFLQKYNKES